MINSPHFVKIVKFLAGGGVAAAINFVLVFYLVEHWGFNTSLLRNLANILAIEAGLIVSFFIYRIWIWPKGSWGLYQILFRQLPFYHLAGGSALIVRMLIIFPILDKLGVNYLLNTFIGMLVGTGINYTISNYIVFRNH